MKWHLCVLLALSACPKADTGAANAVPDAGVTRSVTLNGIGPRLLSNQTSQPLAITGDGLKSGMTLKLGAPLSIELPLTVWDERHAWARLPGGLAIGAASEVVITATVADSEPVLLRFINDTTFPDLTAFARSADGKQLFVVSPNTDELFTLDTVSGAVTRSATLDGPTSLATWRSPEKEEWLVIAHRYAPALLLVNLQEPSKRLTLPAVSNAEGLVVDGDRAFVAEHVRDTVVAYALPGGRELWRTNVSLNPRALVLAGKELVAGSLETGAIDVLNADTGALRVSLEPGPGTPIIGGSTEKYAAQIMNGKAPRALAWSPKARSLFVSSIGPNIGPNADRMEVSMNGGVGAVSLDKGWLRHRGFGAGITEGLAIDDARGLLYAADIGLGLVRVIDVKKLASGDATKAELQALPLVPPSNFPLARPREDFGVKGRAGVSLHTGPRALLLSPDAKTLYVLERFTGSVAVVDVSAPGKAVWKTQWPVVNPLTQPTRRMGQVLYHADLGQTAMSCDACHLEGHNEGVLFAKTNPLRVYRSPTLRGSRETPPFFTPASTFSIGETIRFVGSRNRYHNPDPSPQEIEALTLFASLIPTLPNPFVTESGAPAENVTLPDGHQGNPRNGLALFEGKAECSGCHPAPLFTMDQTEATRGRFIDVGTPHLLPVRPEQQNALFAGFATP